jgi:hypothetical protein
MSLVIIDKWPNKVPGAIAGRTSEFIAMMPVDQDRRTGAAQLWHR